MSPDTLTQGEPSDRFKTLMALLIAVVTLVGLGLAWRTALVSKNASDAELAGLRATLNAEHILTFDTATLYRLYRAFTSYTRCRSLEQALGEQASLTSSDPLLAAQAEAAASHLFFPSRYLARDGSYDGARELTEARAEAGQAQDLQADPHFAEADRLTSKSNWLIGLFIPLSLALVLCTLAEGLHPVRARLRSGVAIAGTALLLLTMGAVTATEILI